MAKRLPDTGVCGVHHRARTICVAGDYFCPDCIDEDLAERLQEARGAAEAAAEVD